MASEMKSVYDFSQHSVLSTALLIADRKASKYRAHAGATVTRYHH